MKLLLCSGPEAPEGFIRLDADPQWKPDILLKLPAPLPNPGEWSEIDLIHGIEHFHIWEAPELLKECHRALAPGGKLVLEQPNLESCAKVLLGLVEPFTEVVGQSDLWAIYGDPRYQNPLMQHKWGYTPLSLEFYLRECGSWSSIEVKPIQTHIRHRDFRMEAVKSL